MRPSKFTFLNERIKVTREQLEKVTETIIGRRPELGPVPPELAQQKAALAEQLQADEARKQGIEDAAAAQKKATSEAEQARKQAASAAEAARKKALQDDLQAIRERAQAAEQAANQEISLTQDLARIKAFIAGPEESVAAQARARSKPRAPPCRRPLPRRSGSLSNMQH